MKKATFQGILDSISTKQDKTLKIVLFAQEMSPENMSKLLSFHQNFCEILLSEAPISEKEIEEAGKDFDPLSLATNKTPSQRLRNVYYLLFEQSKEGFKSFNDYYKSKMEAHIEHLKYQIE